MKQMTKEVQMQKNGGYYWHCHKCKVKNSNGQLTNNRFALTKNAAQKAGTKHASNHTGVAFWSLGLIEDCPNA